MAVSINEFRKTLHKSDFTQRKRKPAASAKSSFPQM